MILAEKGNIDKAKEEQAAKEWYPGKYVGLPDPRRGEWFFGKRLGIRKSNSSELEPTVPNITPLVWRNIQQLCEDLPHTNHLEGVNAVLELCCTTIDDDFTLVMAAMNAVIRLGTGRLDRAIRFGECGACKFVVQLLHWFIYSDVEFPSSMKTEEREYSILVEQCVATILGAVEVLAAGCKPNREILGQMGACSYVMEAFRRHGKNGENFNFTELIFNCIWQLSFGNSYNRSRFRESGAENFLWRLTNSANATPAQRSRGQAVLGWLKSQLAEDLKQLQEPREIVGGLLLSISEITNSSVRGSPTEAVKLASESFLAIMRLCLRANEDLILELLDDFTHSIQIPEKIVQVTRRILRHHKKIFKDDIERLCRFIIASCQVISCLISPTYRIEKNKLEIEAKQNLLSSESPDAKIEENQKKLGTEIESDDDENGNEELATEDYIHVKAVESSQSALVKLNRAKQEKILIEVISKQLQDAGSCRMLVKELELYVDPSSSHYESTPAKHTHIALKSTSLLDLTDPFSVLSVGTGTLTRGVVAGFQGVKSGISLIGDKVQSTLSKSSEPFPDTPEGHCITAVCQSIRLLAEVSLSIRLNFLVENLNTTCKWLSKGPHEIGIKNLQTWFLSQLQNDLMQKWDIPIAAHSRHTHDFLDTDDEDENDENDDRNDDDERSDNNNPQNEEEEIDNGEVTLTIALQILDRFGGKQSNPKLPMDDMMKTVFRDAIDYIGRFVSERGIQGERLFDKQEGYEILFFPINKHLITDFKIIDAWITTITSIGLARIESKIILSDHGACEICLDAIRVHILRPRIVEKCLWCLCVLAANNSLSMARIINWHSDTWNGESATVLLTNLQKNRGQTNETREHAALILSWMSLRQSSTGPTTSTTTTTISTSLPSKSSTDNPSSPPTPSSTISDRRSNSDAMSSVPEVDNFKTGIANNDIFFSFSIKGISKTASRHNYGTTII